MSIVQFLICQFHRKNRECNLMLHSYNTKTVDSNFTKNSMAGIFIFWHIFTFVHPVRIFDQVFKRCSQILNQFFRYSLCLIAVIFQGKHLGNFCTKVKSCFLNTFNPTVTENVKMKNTSINICFCLILTSFDLLHQH